MTTWLEIRIAAEQMRQYVPYTKDVAIAIKNKELQYHIMLCKESAEEKSVQRFGL